MSDLFCTDTHEWDDENDPMTYCNDCGLSPAQADEVAKLQDTANLWQCMQEAGIDNVEAYSFGYQLYYEQYPEKEGL